MPTAIIQVYGTANIPAGSFRRAPKVTISRPGFDTVTLPITDPEVEHTDLAAAWATQDRPGGVPLLGLAGAKLPKQRLNVTVDEDVLDALAYGSSLFEPGALAEQCIADVIALAQPGPPVTVAYSTLEAGTWRITDLRATTRRRHPADNRVLTATLDIELTRASDAPPIALAPAAPPPLPATTPTPQPIDANQRRYTVKSGDSLFGIAQKHYGNGNVWPRIADANKIRDPRTLKVGQVLTIP